MGNYCDHHVDEDLACEECHREEIEALKQERDEARREICEWEVSPYLLPASAAAHKRGWDYLYEKESE